MTKIIFLLTMLLTAYSINAKTTYSTDADTSIPLPAIYDVFSNEKLNIYNNLSIKPPGRFNISDLSINYTDDMLFSSAIIPSANIVARINGPIIIGTSWVNIPENCKLYVEDGIVTERLKVTSIDSTDWTGYVFTENYDLKRIKEVEEFIKANKHLPNVPSAQEVSKNGLDMVEMDATLLRQIEELWLHVIELKKENDALREDVKILKSDR